MVDGATDSGPFGALQNGTGFYSIDGTVTTVAIPGYAATTILGVNASGGTAFGIATTASDTGTTATSNDFVDVGGMITILPTNETPVGVDDSGDVLIETAAGQSFLLKGGVATPLTLPDGTGEVTAISPSGLLAGIVERNTGGSSTHYFVGRPGDWSFYAFVGMPVEVNNSGTVGLDTTFAASTDPFYFAYVVRNGVAENSYSEGRNYVSIAGLNVEGDAVVFADGRNVLLLPDGTAEVFSVNGASFPIVTGIDDQGDIFGTANIDPNGNPYDGYRGSFIAEVPCFAAGTRIATPDGETLVENLRVGDLVRTAGGGHRPVVWTGHRHVDLASHPDPALVRPVVIRRGAIAPGVPARDLRVSPDHNIAFEDVLIPAKCLVDGAAVAVDAEASAVTYHHVELATHDLLLAENLAAESFLDVGNRAALSPNSAGSADFSSAVDTQWFRWEALGCRRLVLAGPELDRARALLRARTDVRAEPGCSVAGTTRSVRQARAEQSALVDA